MQKTKHFTTSCGFCGLELVFPEHRKYLSRPDKDGKKVIQTNHFCDAWCFHQFKKLKGLSPGLAKHIKESRGELIKRGIKLGSATKKIYTSEFLRKLQASTEPTCTYPDCDLAISKIGPRSKWNCCPKHTALVRGAVWAQNKKRKDLVKKHGVEPIEQTFEYLPPATLKCANCKKGFVRSGKHALLPKKNVYCSKVCQFSHRKTSEVTCANCGNQFRRYGSRKWKYCSSKCYRLARQADKQPDKKAVKCLVCAKKFTTYYYRTRVGKGGKIHQKQKYCSRKCFGMTRRKTGGKNVSSNKRER